VKKTFTRLIAALAGFVALTTSAQAGADEARAVHFIPKNNALGDVHPFFENGTYYLFYLKPGEFESALVTSTNLLEWSEVNLRHTAGASDEWLRPYYVLGVFRDHLTGAYRSYYGCRNRMVGSSSTNLIEWSSAPPNESVPDQPDRYERQRDPYVFWNESERRYGCVMTCRLRNVPEARAGAVGYATSADLKTWQPVKDLFFPGDIGEPECPQLFPIGVRWYLLASIYDRAVGKPSYWVSDAPTGPWQTRKPSSLDGKDLCAAQVGFDGRRWLLFGWIPLTASQPGRQHWGGHLALPREVVQNADGSLSARLEPGVGAGIRGERVFALGAPRTVAAESGGTLALPSDLGPFDVETEFRVTRGCQRCGLRLGEPFRVVVDFEKQLLAVEGPAGETVADLPVAVAPDSVRHLRVVVDGDIVEAFLDDRYSLAARLPQHVSHAPSSLFVQSGSVTFEAVRVHRLKAVVRRIQP